MLRKCEVEHREHDDEYGKYRQYGLDRGLYDYLFQNCILSDIPPDL